MKEHAQIARPGARSHRGAPGSDREKRMRKGAYGGMRVTIILDGSAEEVAALADLLQERRPPEGLFSENYISASEIQKQDAETAEHWP